MLRLIRQGSALESISTCIESQYTNDLLSKNEVEAAMTTVNTIQGHTVGYELEISELVANKLGFTTDRLPTEQHNFLHKDSVPLVKKLIEKTGYKYDNDEAYEVSSPPSPHPFALRTATLGLIRSGLIPNDISSAKNGGRHIKNMLPAGGITEHISIGTDSLANNIDYLTILRTAELLGASSETRLLEPSIYGRHCRGGTPISTDWSYAIKGEAGVYIPISTDLVKNWIHENSKRVEFRTLEYTSLDQLSIGLDSLYYLTAGAHRVNDQSSSIYKDFFNNINQVYADRGAAIALPTKEECIDPFKYENYLTPHIRLMRDHEASKNVRSLARSAVLDIREALNQDHIPTPLEKPLET